MKDAISRAAALTAVLTAAAFALSACSVIQEEKIDYKSAKKASTLEVPPDLTQLMQDTRYASSGAAASVSALALQQSGTGVGAQVPQIERAAPLKVGDVQILRDGNKRWLLVQRPAEQLWEPVREFWLDHGFHLEQEKPDLGIIETDWAENRAKLPQDIIRSALGKILDTFYSTGEQDRFRTRLERRTDGQTEIFITHRGMIEVYSSAQKDSTIWQPRPADEELETEFLRRLMVKLGSSEEESQALVASAQAAGAGGAGSGVGASALALTTQGEEPVLNMQEPFDRAWRRVGVALDRSGFTVEDRDRSKGIYYVRYVTPTAQKSDPEKQSWFQRKFSRNKTPPAQPHQYQVQILEGAENSSVGSSSVFVRDAQGQAEVSDTAQRILRVIYDDLK